MNFLGQYMIHPKETLEEEIRFSFNNRKPLIVFDENGELFRKTAGLAEKAGYGQLPTTKVAGLHKE